MKTYNLKNKKDVVNKKSGIVIAGNMNVGKTSLFSRMCGRETAGVNIPGNTVSISASRIKGSSLYALDAPGFFSLFSSNEDSRASREILLPGKTDYNIRGIILVADAKNMKRSIAIALQYAEYGIPMLLDVNMVDEAASRGIEIDYRKLSEALDMEICTTVARDGIGVRGVVSKLSRMRVPRIQVKYPDWVEEFLDITEKLLKSSGISSRITGLLLLAEDNSIENYIEETYGTGMIQQLKDQAAEYRKNEPLPCNILFSDLFMKHAEQIVNNIQEVRPPSSSPILTRFGDWCTRLSTGIPIAIIMIYAM